ncbi:MAG: hypothetical protein IIB87_08995, partial [Chloroflexi bacterium]|nr:hypothetical protein [Chloroflexota bacterium]
IALDISMGDHVLLQNGSAQLVLTATLTSNVPPGAVFVSSYYDGGAISVLLPSENGSLAVPRVKLLKQTNAG